MGVKLATDCKKLQPEIEICNRIEINECSSSKKLLEIVFYSSTRVLAAALPSSQHRHRTSELINVRTWAEENNLKLNCSKSKEIVFTSRFTGASAKYIVLQRSVL